MNSDPEVVATIEQAVDELLPVVVDLGSCSFEAQLYMIEREGEPRVVLHPIASQALPLNHEQLFTLTSAVGGQTWSVRCTDIVSAGPSHAAIGLRGMRFSRTQQPADAVRASDLLVLVVPGGMHDGVDIVFPITRIGQDSCEIRSTAAFPENTVFPVVEIVGDRRLLRTAAAQVTRTTPWYGCDGSRSFVCMLALLEPDSVEVETAEQHDLVTEPGEVKRLLRIAALRNSPATVELPGSASVRARVSALATDHAILELEPRAELGDLGGRRSVRVSFELFSVPHELDVRPLERAGNTLKVALPLILRRRRRHRRNARTNVPDTLHVELRYRHPVTGMVVAHPVLNISFYGVAFLLEANGSVLWPGMPLEQAQLCWGERLVHLGDLIVEETLAGERGPFCRALTHDSRLVDDLDLIDLVGELSNPDLLVHDGSQFAALHQTYLRAGLFGPHMDRNLAPLVEETAATWHAMHTGARDMIRTFVHGPEDAPDAAVTVMRAWEASWLLQHFVDASTERFGATAKLQFAYIEYLLPRPDGRYMIFFVKEDNAIMNAYLKRFFETTGTVEALSCTLVDLWIRPGAGAALAPAASDPAITVEPCSERDELTVAHAARREFGAQAAVAISMTPGQLTLPDTTARFARAGLVRTRDCVLIKRGGRIAFAVLEERSSPGVNLTWMLNAAWIIPVHPELDPDGRALARALQLVVERPAQSATGDRFLNLPPNMDERALEAYGFAREARLNFYALNRAGLHRLFHYNAARYGEVEAMVLRRNRKKNV